MREKLKEREGLRRYYAATFKRFGSKPAYKGPPIKTILLVDVVNATGELITDHLWFTCGKQFARLDLQPRGPRQFLRALGAVRQGLPRISGR